MFSRKPKTRILPRGLLLAAGVLLLAGCEGDMSDDIAQEDSLETTLQQCEVVVGGVVGSPTDPVTIDGEPIRACLLDTDVGQRGEVRLKSTHNFEPLVWVLDGTYEIGESKRYATLADWQADTMHRVEALAVNGISNSVNTQRPRRLYAREGAMVVVHRNGQLFANIESVDDNNTGTGEWAGVVVNGVGPHPDCGSNAGAENFCNIEGDRGYYGGVPSDTDTQLDATGFAGWAMEAGGEPASGIAPSAAVTLNAPHPLQNSSASHAAYSAKTGLELNGGAIGFSIRSIGNSGSAVHWHSGYSGDIKGTVYHDNEEPALRGESGGNTVLKTLTLVDKDRQAGNAIRLSGGGDVAVDNVVIQGFSGCLQVNDGITRVSPVSNSVFYCDSASAAAEDGSDYAADALAAAENFFTTNPDLDPALKITATGIEGINAIAKAPSSPYDFSLTYEACYGVGTPLEETVEIGQGGSYSICELQGEITENLYFDDDINGEQVAWRIRGDVTLGRDFSALDAGQQRALLEAPQKVTLDDTSRLRLPADASLAVNPGVRFTVAGTLENPVELDIRPQDRGAQWGGLTINGLADSCADAATCALAQERFVDIQYLRLLNGGSGQAALTLNEVSAAGQIDNLDIADAAGDGLALNGGAVNIDRLLISGATGDQVQWSHGYRGTLQYAILQADESSLGHALHGRNTSADHDRDPRSRPVLASVTMKGSESADTAILLEQGSGLLLYNSVVANFNTCLDIDHQSTADLQHTDPRQIHFDNVVLDCNAGDNTLPQEDEDGGFDFANTTTGQAGVYEVAAVLDSNFVATGPDIPAIEGAIDFTLAGAAADYLESGADYMGSVRDSMDDWYLDWSDSVGVRLAAECDFKGVLEYFVEGPEIDVDDETGNEIFDYHPQRPVCGLRGTLTEDLLLTHYTGTDREAVESGEQVIDIVEHDGIEYEVARDPLRTTWLFNGLVRVGEGHLEITDTAQVEAMKADPVTLGIEASANISTTNRGGLHITRGGELVALGGERLYEETDPDAAGPITLGGNLIVDGFARNNQCPEAMAEPGSRVCNIQGDFGYHGGYDDDHGNLEVENLHIISNRLYLNSVGRGGKLENLYLEGADTWSALDLGGAMIDIDGGTVNLRSVNIEKVPGSAIRWNHGYRGNMQGVYAEGLLKSSGAASNDPAFFDPLFQDEDGNWQHYPMIRGANGEEGHESDLPRSMPTLANMTLWLTESGDLCSFFGCEPVEVGSTAIELSHGSGVYLHNSVVGGTAGQFDGLYGNILVDQCLSADPSVESLLGEEVILNQVAFGCKEASSDPNLVGQIDRAFATSTHVNSETAVSNKNMLPDPSLADADVYYFDWVLGQAISFYSDVQGVTVFDGWQEQRYPDANLINLGEAPMDYSGSQSADPEFILDTNYFGALDYFVPLEAGRNIPEN
ncbi:hypothetical protein [Microbulbifer halophilus]|uniref:Uncharacterized protein n=1 Tax=Microbulbifer halophilus TaxID=453963 RepID=A0ABW5EEU4_9GAMM|nr:hypothetical protein [Microbulbifer halophilus]MCW8126310.1 hypothetical protein [Microbulbifer halophilus]